MVNDFFSQILQEGFEVWRSYITIWNFENQSWGALHKGWIGFIIAKEKWEWDKIEIYAKRIQHLEKRSGNRNNRGFQTWELINTNFYTIMMIRSS
jgi:hypothetical protein